MSPAEWYQAAKDFAAPVATIIAAATAAFVTFEIQQQNRDLARAKLKLDLYDRRYSVFTATRELLLLRLEEPFLDKNDLDAAVLKRLQSKMAEARFICSPAAQEFCRTVSKVEDDLLIATARAPLWNYHLTQEDRDAAATRPAELKGRLDELRRSIEDAFSEDLKLNISSRSRS